jgi:eukaryotic-like serine/threonine-protein kinase
VTTIDQTLADALRDRYVLEKELGRGGMATVYLARDLRHRRPVAVKVLHPELSAVLGSERFLKEIELTANLQHPHILPLFDSGDAHGLLYYVMPYVEGESPRARLVRERQLPVPDAVRLAGEVAQALAYAHKHGVIHRDIKPENILLHDGAALVADFGIALAVEQAGGERMTRTGLSLGTPQYMAPEQAAGERSVDHRVDIYALGAVTYEMLAGEPPFTGPSAQAIVAKVMTERPRALGTLRPSVPEQVETAVATALEKLPADRFSAASDYATALAAGARSPPGGRPPFGRSTMRQRLSAALALAVVAGGAFLLGRGLSARHDPPLGELGRTVQVTSEPGLEVHAALSPDGRSVAYVAGTSINLRVFVRPVTGGRAIPLTSDSGEVQTNPQWSPDGSRILYLARGGAFSSPSSGGPARQELPAGQGSAVTWAAWSPDGASLAYAVADSLFVRDAAGAVRKVAAFLEPSLCAWSPDGGAIACASGNARYATAGVSFGNLSPSWIVVCRVRDGALTSVTGRTSLNHSPVWSPDGRWINFVSDRDGVRDVYAQRVSSRGEAVGAPARITAGLGAQSISLSPDGRRLAYVAYTGTGNIWSLPRPSSGTVSVSEATPVTKGTQIIENMKPSRDGDWLIYDSNLGGNSDIYRLRLPDGEPERLTTDPADDFQPSLSPDGREVAFHSWRSGNRDIYVMPLDGGPVQRVTSTPRQEWQPKWSPDGSALAYGEGGATGGLWIVRRNSDGSWGRPIRRLGSGGFAPDWSPDGRRLMYGTNPRDQRGQLAVVPVDSAAPQVLIDPARPGQPSAEFGQWSEDGRTIWFKSHDPMGNASIWTVPAAGGKPRLVVRFDDPARPSYRNAWALGRTRIYFTVDDRQGDIWVIEAKRP